MRTVPCRPAAAGQPRRLRPPPHDVQADYRALVTFSWTGPEPTARPRAASSSSIERPAAEAPPFPARWSTRPEDRRRPRQHRRPLARPPDDPEHQVRHLRRRRRLGRRRPGQRGREALHRAVCRRGCEHLRHRPAHRPGTQPGADQPAVVRGADVPDPRRPELPAARARSSITNSYGENDHAHLRDQRRPPSDVRDHDAVRRDACRHVLRGERRPGLPLRPVPAAVDTGHRAAADPAVHGRPRRAATARSDAADPAGQRRVVAPAARRADGRLDRAVELLLPVRAERRRRQRETAGARADHPRGGVEHGAGLPRHHPRRAAEPLRPRLPHRLPRVDGAGRPAPPRRRGRRSPTSPAR